MRPPSVFRKKGTGPRVSPMGEDGIERTAQVPGKDTTPGSTAPARAKCRLPSLCDGRLNFMSYVTYM